MDDESVSPLHPICIRADAWQQRSPPSWWDQWGLPPQQLPKICSVSWSRPATGPQRMCSLTLDRPQVPSVLATRLDVLQQSYLALFISVYLLLIWGAGVFSGNVFSALSECFPFCEKEKASIVHYFMTISSRYSTAKYVVAFQSVFLCLEWDSGDTRCCLHTLRARIHSPLLLWFRFSYSKSHHLDGFLQSGTAL